MQRILQYVIGNMNQGGLENNLMEIYREINKEEFQFDFITHSENNYYENEIKKLGGKVYAIPFKSDRFSEALNRFKKILFEHEEYTIIHFHTSYAIILPEVYIAKNLGRKVFVHAHASAGEGVKKKLINYIFKKKLDKLADMHIAVSKSAAKWQFSKKTIKIGNYIIINNSINTKLFKYDPELRETVRKRLGYQNKFILGTTGRLAPGKNIQFLIELMDILELLIPNIKLILVGDGPDRQKLEVMVREKGLASVEFIGKTDRVYEYLNAFDVFCFPSLYEGLGLSVIEAESTGVPCLINKKLPNELNIIKDVYRLSMKHIIWVKKIQEIYLSSYKRKNQFEAVNGAGFGIEENVNIWERLYREEV